MNTVKIIENQLGSSWNCYRDESIYFPADNYNSNPITNSKSFKYKSILKGKTPDNSGDNNNNIKEHVEVVVCEKNLILTWSENYILTDIITRAGNPDTNPAVENIKAPKSAKFKIEDTELYVPVVTLSAQD